MKRLEAVRRKQLPRLRDVRLYIEGKTRYYFPLGAFSHKLPDDRKLSTEFIYTGNPSDEQQRVLDEISLLSQRTGLIEMKTGRGK